MKNLPHRFFIYLLGLVVCTTLVGAAGKPVRSGTGSGNKSAPNFQRTKARIDALLAPRLKPEPLPDILPNPFQLAEVAPSSSTRDKDPKPEALPASSDSEMLLYYGAGLKISGTVRINDRTHLVINQAPYKEGDILTLKTKDGAAKLRIIGIAPGELTLGLNDAVQVVKFKK